MTTFTTPPADPSTRSSAVRRFISSTFACRPPRRPPRPPIPPIPPISNGFDITTSVPRKLIAGQLRANSKQQTANSKQQTANSEQVSGEKHASFVELHAGLCRRSHSSVEVSSYL